jgi:murein DD-endopeptidase MepM/ murein hydrolase activator NlpD
MTTVPIASFPLLVPPGWCATAQDRSSSGELCHNAGGNTYRSRGETHPAERPVFYDSFLNQRGSFVHHATDISCARGTPVVSTTDGRVLTETTYRGERRAGAGQSERGGNYAYIRDAAGNTHYYSHMDSLRVRPGQEIKAGQQIGTCGDTGNARGGCPHLHYGIRDSRGRPINPYTLMLSRYTAGGWRGRPKGSFPRWVLGAGFAAVAVAFVGGAYWYSSTA